MKRKVAVWALLFINILLLGIVFLSSKQVVYENKVSLDHFLVGEKIPDLKSSQPGITFYYIFKFGNCPACREEIFFINDLYKQFNKDINFVGIMSFCGDIEMQKRFLKGTGIKIDKIIYDDDFEKWKDYGFLSYPVKVICNSEGKILFADSTLYLPNDKTGKRHCLKLTQFIERLRKQL